ncbi:toprim domain-containing protein, partial [Pelobium sp.]
QIKLISRFTKSITILYDGDAAGIKASLRGLDMILEEGLDVKVVLFPDGHDPDSYIQQLGADAFKTHIEKNKKDFIFYKTEILLKDAANDPIKKAGVIREVVESIAKIPDAIKASVFLRECSNLLEMEERILISELNKIKRGKDKRDSQNFQKIQEEPIPAEFEEVLNDKSVRIDEDQEKEIVRILISYGNQLVTWEQGTEAYIGPYIILNLSDVVFTNFIYSKIVKFYQEKLEKGILPNEKDFIQHEDIEISSTAISCISSQYQLSNYQLVNITVKTELDNFKKTVIDPIFHLKKKRIEVMLDEKIKEISIEKDEINSNILMKEYLDLKKLHVYIANHLGVVITR